MSIQKSNNENWLIALPPEGAARAVGEQFILAFKEELRGGTWVFDAKKYLTAYRSLLKSPDETMVVDLMNQSLLVQCVEKNITHFLCLSLVPVTLFTLNQLKKLGTVNVHWFYEDYRRASYWRDVLSGYHLMLAIQKGPIQEECDRAQVEYHYLPTASGVTGTPLPSPYTNNKGVVFLGVPSPYRIEVLEFLNKEGFSLIIGGLGWKGYQGPLQPCIVSGDWVDEMNMQNMYSKAKVGLNLSFENPFENLRGNPDTHLSPRIFEILHCGLCLVTEETPLCRELEAECYTFSGMESLPGAISRGLEAWSSPEQQRNVERIKKSHTYKQRAASIINWCRDYSAKSS